MRKCVNNVVVDVKAIELYEKAFEGIILNSQAISTIENTIENANKLVKFIVEAYNDFHSKIPSPLYAVETNMKYVVLAKYIMNRIDQSDELRGSVSVEDIALNDCIYIKIEEDKVLKLIYKTWAIEALQDQFEDNSSLDLEDYVNEVGYEEFIWFYEQMISGSEDIDLNEYYNVFMKEFIDACKHIPTVLNWELNRILDFGRIPKQMKFEKNRIVNLDTRYSYFLDIYLAGTRKSNQKNLSIVISNNRSKIEESAKIVDVYDFDVYGKSIDSGLLSKKDENKIEKKDIDGMVGVFKILLNTASELGKGIENIEYHGIVDDDSIIFSINNNVYSCDFNKSADIKILARNVEIHGYESNRLYLVRAEKLKSGVIKEKIYAYNIRSEQLKVCKIQFKQG